MAEMLLLVPEGEILIVMTDNRQILSYFNRSEKWSGVDYLAAAPNRKDGDYWMRMTAAKRYRRVLVTQYPAHGNAKHPENYITAKKLAESGVIPMGPGDAELLAQSEFKSLWGVPRKK